MIPILSSLAFAALLAGAPPAVAARCPLTPLSAEEREDAQAVFVGRVVSQRDSMREFPGMRNSTIEVPETEYKMVISASWRLPAGVSDTIRVWNDSGPESLVVKQGETYLVYAGSKRHPSAQLYVWGCGRSAVLSRASADIAALSPPLTGALSAAGYPPPLPPTAGASPDAHPHR